MFISAASNTSMANNQSISTPKESNTAIIEQKQTENRQNSPKFLIQKETKQNDSIPLNLSDITTFITSSDVPQPLKQELIRNLKKNQNFNEYQKIKINDDIKINEKLKSQVGGRIHFTKEEDEKIKLLVDNIGTRQWPLISTFLNGRTAKQCRDRYANYLMPGFFQGEWTKEEDELLAKLFHQHGPKWSIIHKHLPNRSSNSIKNHWNYYFRRQNKENQKNLQINQTDLQSINESTKLISKVEINSDSSQMANSLSNQNNQTNEINNCGKNDEIANFFGQEKDLFGLFNSISVDKEWMIFN